MVAKEKRHALRYKPAVAVRAAYERLDAVSMSIEGAITDFSVAGAALHYADASIHPSAHVPTRKGEAALRV